MGKRAYNFNAGPAALPMEVLEQARDELLDYRGIGMSVMEISHRSAEYEALNEETQQLFAELLGLPARYQVLFLQGGASTQFAMIPMNFLKSGKVGSYAVSGAWAEKALKEAKLFGETEIAASSKEQSFMRMPDLESVKLSPDSAYLHITSNETIEGSQYVSYPETGKIPLIGDLSSDILCRPVDVSKFAFIYAGAQKNLGPSGVTVVILRKDLLEEANSSIPVMFRYETHAKNNSLYNTPPVYSVYIMNLVLKWVKSKGGLVEMEVFNREKTGLIYDVIDRSGGFYKGCVDKGSRSIMNLTFRLQNEELEKQFIKESQQQGFVGLKGHRSVGGLRASTYNAVPYEFCKALAEFMQEFQRRNG
ncbi:3-phosphoserine/phosphohydroxythreonine transaminase [Paenibacillus larvae]|uniref:3-phosphoserine/phosphohydroxythreonine transaminase n=1 Tax=Paenibacillus larvae TaxID=1464 RepID=UPI0033FD84CC